MSAPDDPPFPHVMLLAAGLGTRMRPLSASMPKPLIPVAGRALLDHVVDAATAEGATAFVINAHYLASRLVAHAGDLAARLGIEIAVSDESERLLDTGGGLKQALPLLRSDPVLVMNTDAFWAGADRPLRRMIAQLETRDADIVLLCVHPRNATGFRRSHDFCLDPLGRVTRDAGAPVIYAGVALMRRSCLADTPDGPFSLNRVFEAALERERLYGAVLDAAWLHVGDPEAIAEAERVLSSLRR